MDYKITVGVEVHCELKTKEKIFSPSKSYYGSMANTNINVIDLGYPGVLPQLNKEVLEYAIRACKVLDLNISYNSLRLCFMKYTSEISGTFSKVYDIPFFISCALVKFVKNPSLRGKFGVI